MSIFDFDDNQGYTVDGLFGSKIHYDAYGNYVGRSDPGIIPGTYNHYGPAGEFEGYSDPGLLSGTMNHHDASGKFVGYSNPGIIMDANHYDASGRYVGSSMDGLFSTKTTLNDDFDDEREAFGDDSFDE